MNRYQFILTLQNKLPNYKTAVVEDGVKIIFKTMADAIINGDRVEIRGFGAFSTKNIAARTSRNPRTGETIKKQAKKKVHFKPGKDLKERVNKGAES